MHILTNFFISHQGNLLLDHIGAMLREGSLIKGFPASMSFFTHGCPQRRQLQLLSDCTNIKANLHICWSKNSKDRLPCKYSALRDRLCRLFSHFHKGVNFSFALLYNESLLFRSLLNENNNNNKKNCFKVVNSPIYWRDQS